MTQTISVASGHRPLGLGLRTAGSNEEEKNMGHGPCSVWGPIRNMPSPSQAGPSSPVPRAGAKEEL